MDKQEIETLEQMKEIIKGLHQVVGTLIDRTEQLNDRVKVLENQNNK